METPMLDAPPVAAEPISAPAAAQSIAISRLTPLFLIKSLVIVLGLMPAYLLFLLIGRYGINMPYWDEWYTFAYFYIHPDAPLWEYWKLYNGHRNIIPKVLGVLLSMLTHLNQKSVQFLNLGLAVLTFAGLYLIFCKRSTSRRAFLIVLPFGLLVFSLAQWPFWVVASSFSSWIAILGCVAAIWGISNFGQGWRALFFSAAMAYLASLSLFAGNIVWLIIPPLMWVIGYRKWHYYLAWAAMAASVLIPFTIEYLLESSVSGIGSLSLIAHFVLAFIGSPLAFNESSYTGLSVALPMGLLGLSALPVLALAIIRFVEDGLRKVAPWLALSGWVIVNALFGAFGRVVEFGPLVARAYRYTPYGILFWISIAALIMIALSEPRRNRSPVRWPQTTHAALIVFPIGVALLMSFGYTNALLTFIDNFNLFDQAANRGYQCLLTYETASDDCLKDVNPFPDFVRWAMPILIERHASFTLGMQFPVAHAALDTPFGDNTHYETRTLDGTPTYVLFQHPPSTLTWTLKLHAAAHISFSTGVLVDIPAAYSAAPGDGAVFVIRVTGEDGSTHELFKRLVLPRKPGDHFDPVTVDLSAYAGETIRLSLITQNGLDVQATSNYDWAMWLPPSLDYQ